MSILPRGLAAALAAAALVAACANPVPPTGGPEDRDPPLITASLPEAGAVNVAADALTLTFSEHVDQASFARALTLTPEFEGRLEYRWRGRQVEVRFPEPLRANTTYILTLDTALRDLHGMALRRPLTLAFSTGPEIARGRLEGRVVEPLAGQPLAGLDVFAYARPDTSAPATLPERPDFRTQTADDGRFRFEYLNEQPYFVVAVQDRNRNRLPDAAERVAPPPVAAVRADTAAVVARPWVAAVRDTAAPVLQRVRPLSSRRLEARFSEPVAPDTAAGAWSVTDSLSGAAFAVRAVYAAATPDRVVYVLTDSLPASGYHLRAAGVVDTSGTPARPVAVGFHAVPLADTMRVRFEGFLPGGDDPVVPLLPGEHPALRFNQPVLPETVRTLVAVDDTSGRALPFTVATGGAVARLAVEAPAGTVVRVRVPGAAVARPDTTFTRLFRSLPPAELGELSGVVAAPDATAVVVELWPAEGEAARRPLRVAAAGADGAFLFRDLPAGRYRLRAFADADADGRWSPGAVTLYVPPEPLAWSADSLRVRPRWENALADTLRFTPPPVLP